MGEGEEGEEGTVDEDGENLVAESTGGAKEAPGVESSTH